MGCRGVRPRVRYDGLSQEGNQERFAVGSRPSPSRPCCPYPDAMRRCGNQNKRRAARGEKRSRNLCVPKGRRLEDGDGKGRLPTTNHHPFFLSNNLHAKTCPRTTHREGWGDVGQLLRLDLILYMHQFQLHCCHYDHDPCLYHLGLDHPCCRDLARRLPPWC